jgi:ABC-type cobalt transport system substrate-binding protein
MPDHFAFSYRIVLLLGLMLVVSLVDFHRNGARAAKFREYGFIVITGAVGAAVGFGNDLITSSISPDYFTLGKGLEEGPDLQIQAGLFGLQVGFSAGVIGGAVCLYACRGKSACPPAPFSCLFRWLWMPVAGAILGGIAVPMAFSRFDPARFSAQLDTLLDAARISRFRQVWWTHIGLYAGLAIGLAAMLLRAAKERKKPEAASLSKG